MKNKLSLAFMILGVLLLPAFFSPYLYSGCLGDGINPPTSCWDFSSAGEAREHFIETVIPFLFLGSFLTWGKWGLQ
jgi:hypothetical protein